jgi:enoyl-CoA hydratase
MTDVELVTVERFGGVAVLSLNAATRRNVLSAELVAAMGQAIDEIESDPDARCLVLTGRGAAFCAGAELSTLEAAADGDFERVRVVYDGFLRVLRSPLVTIAAVNGPAVGAGFNLALSCDVRLASASAWFDTRFAQLRIHPGGGHAWMLTRAVGVQQATLAVVFGQTWDADKALAVGLVSAVHPDHELVHAAVELGRKLDGQEAVYTRRLIRTLRESVSTVSHDDAFASETEAQHWSSTRPAFRQGIADVGAALRRTAPPTS